MFDVKTLQDMNSFEENEDTSEYENDDEDDEDVEDVEENNDINEGSDSFEWLSTNVFKSRNDISLKANFAKTSKNEDIEPYNIFGTFISKEIFDYMRYLTKPIIHVMKVENRSK